ncbi:MAG TPA: MmgE/PrpD family protein, partial [Burkholderiales bacterium]|nr:MmgE/PrpD family protein [Burkholderiales bacterium]
MAIDNAQVVKRLVSYITAAPRKRLPARVTERAKHHLLDTLSAMLSGSRLLPGRRAIEFARSQGGNEEACVIGSDIVTSATMAALANGMHGHADETDDTDYLALVHPGCSIVPAALAMAERTRSGGEALLNAIVLGYDVCARLSQALGIEKFRTYGHSSHSFGGMLGSGVAAGALAGLDAAGVRNVLSYTAQQLSGLSCWARDVEHVQKAFHFGGMPARNGVTAAIMAQMGFTGVDDTLEGERGFFQAFREFIEPEKLVADLGRVYEIENTSIKRWAVGYPIQAPLDAVSNLIERHGVNGEDVERVLITIDDQGARTVNQRKMASINVQHLVAMMLIDGEITFASAHDEKRVQDPAVLKMRKRIELQGSAALGRAKTTQAILEITTREGQRLRHHTKAVLGTAANPMSREQVAAKSRDLLLPVIGARRAENLIKTVWDIEQVTDVRKLRRL